jgi:hypothetical protein
MRTLLALGALVLAIAVSGCGGGGSTGTQTAPTANTGGNTGGGSAQGAVAAAGAKTQGEQSARVSFTATFTGGKSAGKMAGEGAFAKRKGRLTLDMSGLAGGELGSGKAELIFNELVYYMKLPASAGAQLPAGKKWFKIDLAALGQERGLDLEQLMQLNQSDPSQALDFIRGASADFAEVGKEDVRGEETTHYKGTIDLEKVAAEAPADIRDQYRRLFQLGGDKKVPMEVWIGDDGLVRKIRFTQDLPDKSTLTMEEELYDFGTEVDVNPPPDDEVLDLTDLLGNG